MPRTGQTGTNSALLAVLMAVTLAAAACGTVHQSASAGRQPADRTAATAAPESGPAAGSRALARQTSSWLLRILALPSGTRPDRSGPVPGAIRRAPEGSASGHLLARHEIFTVPHPAAWVDGYVRRHPPPGLKWAGDGSSGTDGLTFVVWAPRHLQRGLYQAQLLVSVLPATGDALVRADTQVIWYPPRSRAEYVSAGRFAAAHLREHLLNPRPHTVRKVITSRAVIARLAGTLNSLPADPGLQYGCPAILAEYQVTFVPRAAGQLKIVAVPDGCNSVGMWAGGQPEPDLTGGWATITLINRLLGLTRSGAPARR